WSRRGGGRSVRGGPRRDRAVPPPGAARRACRAGGLRRAPSRAALSRGPPAPGSTSAPRLPGKRGQRGRLGYPLGERRPHPALPGRAKQTVATRVLVVDDERDIVSLVRYHL